MLVKQFLLVCLICIPHNLIYIHQVFLSQHVPKQVLQLLQQKLLVLLHSPFSSIAIVVLVKHMVVSLKTEFPSLICGQLWSCDQAMANGIGVKIVWKNFQAICLKQKVQYVHFSSLHCEYDGRSRGSHLKAWNESGLWRTVE